MPSHLKTRFLVAAAVTVLGVVPTFANGQGTATLSDSLIPEMESVFAENPGMIEHTNTVLGHAVDIQGREGGALTPAS